MKKDNTTDDRSKVLDEAFKEKLQNKRNVIRLMALVPDFAKSKLQEKDIEECEELVLYYPPKEYSILRRGTLRKIKGELFFFMGLTQHEENIPDLSCLKTYGITPVVLNIAAGAVTDEEILKRTQRLNGKA